MSKQKIQTRYKRIRSREQESLFQALMNDQTNICKDFMINLNTDTNLTIHTLKKKFRLLNAIVNRKLFKNYQKCPDKRVSFIGFFERELNNNHINLLLKIPKEYDVLRMSYGLDCVKHSATEIANKIGINGTSSYVRVSQLKKQAIQKLIENVDSSQVIDFL